jgi:FtsP/CotA-like multicopper oxidase with cupredoxin domain
VEGERVPVIATNELGEPTRIGWHGQRLPDGMVTG